MITLILLSILWCQQDRNWDSCCIFQAVNRLREAQWLARVLSVGEQLIRVLELDPFQSRALPVTPRCMPFLKKGYWLSGLLRLYFARSTFGGDEDSILRATRKVWIVFIALAQCQAPSFCKPLCFSSSAQKSPDEELSSPHYFSAGGKILS